MAIEAAKQTADGSRLMAGYSFKNVTFFRALVVNLEPEGVEIQFYLRPVTDVSDKHHVWNEFRLFYLEDGEWAENCRGSISVKYVESYPQKKFQ